MFSLILFKVFAAAAASKTAQVCLFRNQGQVCENYSYKCDFKTSEMAQNMNRTDRLWNNEQSLRWDDVLRQTDFPKHFVKQGYFGRMIGQDQLLYTTGMWPCGAVALINSSCSYASLSHYDMTDPRGLVPVMAADLKKQVSCLPQKTDVYILASNILFEKFGRKVDNLYFRRIVCSARDAFPEARILVVYSTKTQTDSDSLFIFKTREGYGLKLTRENGEVRQSIRFAPSLVENLPVKTGAVCNQSGCSVP